MTMTFVLLTAVLLAMGACALLRQPVRQPIRIPATRRRATIRPARQGEL